MTTAEAAFGTTALEKELAVANDNCHVEGVNSN
jgi:hypothetical protein